MTLKDDQERLREAWLDLAYELNKPIIALVERVPWLRVKPWVRERQIRERHRRER